MNGEGIHSILEGHIKRVSCVSFSPDSKYIASGSSDKTIRLWNVEKGLVIGEALKGHIHVSFSILFSPNGMHLTSGSSRGIIIWNVESREMKYPPLISQSDIRSFAFSRNSSKIVSGTKSGTFRVWDV